MLSQLIGEKLAQAGKDIPAHFGTPEMAPISTGLGEIFQYTLETKPGYEDQYSVMDLREVQDWLVKRQLTGIPGVVEINTWGGFLKQYEISMQPEKLRSMDISLLEVFNALETNNENAGGAFGSFIRDFYLGGPHGQFPKWGARGLCHPPLSPIWNFSYDSF